MIKDYRTNEEYLALAKLATNLDVVERASSAIKERTDKLKALKATKKAFTLENKIATKVDCCKNELEVQFFSEIEKKAYEENCKRRTSCEKKESPKLAVNKFLNFFITAGCYFLLGLLYVFKYLCIALSILLPYAVLGVGGYFFIKYIINNENIWGYLFWAENFLENNVGVYFFVFLSAVSLFVVSIILLVKEAWDFDCKWLIKTQFIITTVISGIIMLYTGYRFVYLLTLTTPWWQVIFLFIPVFLVMIVAGLPRLLCSIVALSVLPIGIIYLSTSLIEKLCNISIRDLSINDKYRRPTLSTTFHYDDLSYKQLFPKEVEQIKKSKEYKDAYNIAREKDNEITRLLQEKFNDEYNSAKQAYENYSTAFDQSLIPLKENIESLKQLKKTAATAINDVYFLSKEQKNLPYVCSLLTYFENSRATTIIDAVNIRATDDFREELLSTVKHISTQLSNMYKTINARLSDLADEIIKTRIQLRTCVEQVNQNIQTVYTQNAQLNANITNTLTQYSQNIEKLTKNNTDNIAYIRNMVEIREIERRNNI